MALYYVLANLKVWSPTGPVEGHDFKFVELDDQVFSLTIIITRIVYNNGFYGYRQKSRSYISSQNLC